MHGRNVLKRCFLCFAAAAAGVFCVSPESGRLAPSAAQDAAAYDQRLAELDSEQAELDSRLAAAESRADAGQDKLNAVTAKLKSLRDEQSELEQLNQRIIAEMVETDADLRETAHLLEEQEAALKEEVNDYSGRLRALYLAGSESYADIIFTSKDFFDVLMRTELVKRVAEHDKTTIDGLLEKLREVKARKEEAEARSSELKAKTQEYSERREQLEKSIAEQKALEEKYSDELEAAGILTDELAEESRRLEEERAEVSRKASEAMTTTTSETTASTTAAAAASTTKKTTAAPAGNTETTTKKSAATEAPEVTAAETETTAAAKATTKATTAAAAKATTKATTAPAVSNDRDAKIKKVLDYALSNVGGTYVWGGASFRACDCSGLTMLAYHQIGIEIPHWTVTQCQQGWAVSYSELQPGDLVFFGGSSYSSVYHAAMYIGGGQIVHAENSQTGIVISDLARFSRWNPIAYMRRLI